MRRALALLAPSLFLCSPSPAQSLHWSASGNWPSSTYGAVIASVGDLNGDGLDDLLVGDLDASPVLLLQGRATVYSGADGSVIYTIDGQTSLEGFGSDVAGAGDVDADGVPDFVVSALQDQPRVFSGATGALLVELGDPWVSHRARVAAAGDLNGDGFDDVLVGDPFATTPAGVESGQVHVFHGAKLAVGIDDVLYTRDGTQAYGHFGTGLACVADLDSDGRGEFIVSAPDETGFSGFQFWCGVARVYSGASGSVMRLHKGSPLCTQFALSIADAGDVDQDGLHDYLLGSPGAYGGVDNGEARLHSGATGALLHQFLGDDPLDFFGYCVRGGRDVNGDGWPDLLIGAPWDDDHGYAWGSASLYSGRDFSLLHEFGGQGGQLGSSVATLGDVDGDGVDDLALAAPTAQSTFGEVFVYAGDCTGAVVEYCGSQPNSSGEDGLLTAQGSTSLASNDLSLHAQFCPPGQPGIFFYGPSQTAVPLGDGVLCVGGQIYRLLPAETIDAAGQASRALDVTQPPAAAGPGMIQPGSTWNFQFWFRDPTGPAGGGSNLTDALSITFCP